MNQHTTDRPLITQAIIYLNNRYGYGDVRAVRRFMDGRIEVDVQGFGMKTKTYIASAVGRESVRFRNHQVNFRTLAKKLGA